MKITALEFLLLSINLTYLENPGKVVSKAKTCHVFPKWSSKSFQGFSWVGECQCKRIQQLGDLPSTPSCPYTCSQELSIWPLRESERKVTSKCVTRGANPPLNAHLNKQLLQQKNPGQNFESGRIPKSIQQYIQSGLWYRKLKEGMQNYCRRLLNLMLFKMPLGSETERFRTC